VLLSFTSTSQPNGLYVYRSTDGGVSWGPPLEVINQYPGVFEDKEFLACDRTAGAHRGNLYVCWTRFGYTTDIVMRRSTTGGTSWGSTTTVSDQSGVQFPIPVVGRGGELYIAWTSYSYSSILIDRSTNGGVSFGSDRTVTSVYTPSTVLNGGIDAYSSPHMDADLTPGPYGGRLYLAFMDRRGGLADFDIWVTYSDNGGTSWSTPARVNDDAASNGRDQFLPWLSVDNQGVVSVVFLDRRHDPQNRTYHCYLAQSTDGGAHWAPNVRISTQPSDPFHAAAAGLPEPATPPVPAPTPSRAGLLGEYIGVVSWDGVATPVWTDIRNLNQDVYAGYWAGGMEAVEGEASARLTIAPNPAVAGETTLILGAPGAAGPLGIFDAAGRRVRTLVLDRRAAWDGRDAAGRRLPAGAYFLRRPGHGGPSLGAVLIVE
jgi:hypothetical protein